MKEDNFYKVRKGETPYMYVIRLQAIDPLLFWKVFCGFALGVIVGLVLGWVI